MKSYWVIESIVCEKNYLGKLGKEDFIGVNFDYAERFHTKEEAKKRWNEICVAYQDATEVREVELPGVETEHLFLDSLQTGGYHIRDKSDFHIVEFLMGTDEVPSVKYLNYYEEKCYKK